MAQGSTAKIKKDKPQWVWEKVLKPGVVGVPVWTFRHAPLSMYWAKLALENMLVETELRDDNGLHSGVANAHWIAHVASYAGYMAKIIYEGYEGNEESKAHWAHFCKDLHRIGYCGDHHLPIVPPRSVTEQKQEWREWIIKRVTGGYTMHALTQQLITYDTETQLRKGTEVEVLDKTCISQMRVGYVQEVVGHRVHVRYWDPDGSEDNSFWCHEQSDAINVVSWSKTVGHAISAPQGYNPAEIGNSSVIKKSPGVNIQLGMILEAVDPLNLFLISAATVVKVLRNGYFMVHIDSIGPPVILNSRGTENDSGHGNNRFCYHVASPLIFYCGFCKEHGIDLTPPSEYEHKPDSFDWTEYFIKTGQKALPLKDMEKEEIQHGFQVGAKLEAVDVMEPNLICAATIRKVVGTRLLRIGFDGWGDNYDQWADATSCGLFPVGWCELMNYPLQPPPTPDMPRPVAIGAKKAKQKNGGPGRSKRQSSDW